MSRLEWIFTAAGVLMYGLGTLASAAAARTGDRRRLAQARLCGLLGAAYHLFVLVSLGARTGHFPVTGAPEAFLALSAVVTLVALAFDALRKLPILLLGTLPLSLATSILATALLVAPAPAGPPEPGMSSAWTALHIFTSLGAYGAFAFAFVMGILYLVAQRRLKEKDAASIFGLMPPLQSLSRLLLRAIAIGAALMAGGIVVGYGQAREVYNRAFDRWDPKIILSTLTLVFYAAVLFLNSKPAFRGRRTALAAIAGFLLVMVTFWASIFWSDFHKFR